MDFLPEPYKTKTVERIHLLSREKRQQKLIEAHFNPFKIPAADVFIDLLTDSGTSAMSDNQWAGLQVGDESYAGCRNYYFFEEIIKGITGFKHVIPVHQGRAAENILFSNVLKKGDYVPSNTHFDTTRANIENQKAHAIDLLIDEGKDTQYEFEFKGNIDLNKVEDLIKRIGPEKIPLGMLTITNNAGGGQPVSLENIKAYSELLHENGIPLYIDACRYAENCYFIKKRESKYKDKTIKEIAQNIFLHVDGCFMSAKKDGLANMGGFLAFNDDELADKASNTLILLEGFPTYGGMAGRDLEVVARGLIEALDEEYLHYRIEQVRNFGQLLQEADIPILKPTGGHAVFVDVASFLPGFPREKYPGWALAVSVYREGGVRVTEVGGVMRGLMLDGTEKFPELELVRLAVPRRVYSMSHLQYVVSVFKKIKGNKSLVKPLRIIWQAPVMRNFTVKLEEIL
jgi:tryptophanase